MRVKELEYERIYCLCDSSAAFINDNGKCTRYEVSGYLDASECDYWWIRNVDKGDLALLTINGGGLSWQSRLCYSNLTVVKNMSEGGTHIYEFFANKT